MEKIDTSDFELSFNFKFNLHKSIISIGIEDSDWERLAVVYGTDLHWVKTEVEKIEREVQEGAKKVASAMNLDKLKAARSLKVAFLGDSITSDRQSYLQMIREVVKDIPAFEIIDFSISGHKSGDLLTAMFPNVVGAEADIVHIMIGTNDLRRNDDKYGVSHTSIQEFEKNMNYIVGILREEGTKVILSTVPPFSQAKAVENFVGYRMLFREEDRQAFNEVLRKIARKYGAIVNEMDEIYGQYTPDELTLIDGIHLNQTGQELLAEGVVKKLVEMV